jgi:hypothetical protein
VLVSINFPSQISGIPNKSTIPVGQGQCKILGKLIFKK